MLHHYEREVVERFVENYLKALRECEVEEKHGTANPSPLCVKDHRGSYRLGKEWKCECGEFEKTGVGCCHMIAAAIETEGRSYTTLISKKWMRKDKPSRTEEKK